MKQPRKDVLREQLALAADEIIRLRRLCGLLVIDLQSKKTPWWRRWFA